MDIHPISNPHQALYEFHSILNSNGRKKYYVKVSIIYTELFINEKLRKWENYYKEAKKKKEDKKVAHTVYMDNFSEAYYHRQLCFECNLIHGPMVTAGGDKVNTTIWRVQGMNACVDCYFMNIHQMSS